jgi:hypothetical protein
LRYIIRIQNGYIPRPEKLEHFDVLGRRNLRLMWHDWTWVVEPTGGRTTQKEIDTKRTAVIRKKIEGLEKEMDAVKIVMTARPAKKKPAHAG